MALKEQDESAVNVCEMGLLNLVTCLLIEVLLDLKCFFELDNSLNGLS
jgi:hypothetical protein